MKKNTITKILFLSSTILFTAGFASADVVVTDSTTRVNPVKTVDNGVSNVVNSTTHAIKRGAEAITDSIGITHSNNEEVTPSTSDTTIVPSSEKIVKHHRGYLNGYKGYRYARPHYVRYQDGWYYPKAAFKMHEYVDNGNVSTSDTTVAPGSKVLPQAHVNYCVQHYKSYRAYDNSFQPYHGPRQQCYSKYYRG